MAKANYYSWSKEDCVMEINTRQLDVTDIETKSRNNLVDILKKNDEDIVGKEQPPVIPENNSGWIGEKFAVSKTVVAQGYYGKSKDGIELQINPGISTKGTSSSGLNTVYITPGLIYINKKLVEQVTGLSNDAVYTFVNAKVLILSKEQEAKYAETFYKKK